MKRLSITIDGAKNAQMLKAWLRHIDFVKSVDEDHVSWALPGAPASKEQIQQMLDDCMASDEGMEAGDFFASLK